jgi:hypothetical protein
MANLTLAQEFEEIICSYEDRYSWALSRILELEDLLEDAQDQVHRLVNGDAVEWDLA